MSEKNSRYDINNVSDPEIEEAKAELGITSDGEDEFGVPDVAEDAESAADLLYSEEQVVYESKRFKADETKASGQGLLIVGFAGLIMMVLSKAKIISFVQFDTFPTIVFFVMFIAMTLGGFYSIRKSKEIYEQADVEDEFTDKIKKYLKNNMDKDRITQADVAGLSDEENFLNRIAYIKSEVNREIPGLDENFVDTVIEEYYNELFGE